MQLVAMFALGASLCQNPLVVDIAIYEGKFSATRLKIPPGGMLRITNRDLVAHIVEAAGALPGDVNIPPGESRATSLMAVSGSFRAIIEENPEADLVLELTADPSIPSERSVPFDEARAKGRQPLLFEPGNEPLEYAYSSFDFAVTGADSQQAVLKSLYWVQQSIADENPPPEFSLYFQLSDWVNFRKSVSMIYALGPGAYAKSRFGAEIANMRPFELTAFPFGPNVRLSGQRDILVRVASDRRWFNQRVLRWIWRRLGSQIKNVNLEIGYGNPGGRSPLLGGFFDGTGNPYGADRDRAVFGNDHGTYLAFFKIGFDEGAFYTSPVRQKMVGREIASGKPLKTQAANSHVRLAKASSDVRILRQPAIFDDAPGHSGLLFASLQTSPKAIERILGQSMIGGQDALMKLMRFETASLYWVPGSARGTFPGSIRSRGK